MPITDDMKLALYAERSEEPIAILLRVEHDDLAAPILVTNHTEAITSDGDTYQPVRFEFPWTADKEDEPFGGQLRLPNISREYSAAIMSISSPATVTAYCVRVSAPDVIEMQTIPSTLLSTSWDRNALQASFGMAQFQQRMYPADAMAPWNAPGIFASIPPGSTWTGEEYDGGGAGAGAEPAYGPLAFGGNDE
jgi:hypothetical protein